MLHPPSIPTPIPALGPYLRSSSQVFSNLYTSLLPHPPLHARHTPSLHLSPPISLFYHHYFHPCPPLAITSLKFALSSSTTTFNLHVYALHLVHFLHLLSLHLHPSLSSMVMPSFIWSSTPSLQPLPSHILAPSPPLNLICSPATVPLHPYLPTPSPNFLLCPLSFHHVPAPFLHFPSPIL